MPRPRGKAATVFVLLGLVAGMGGLVAAAVPLYNLFCRVTGYNGTVSVAETGAGQVLDRAVTVRFDTTVNSKLPWRFEPPAQPVHLRLGENALVHFTAENPTDEPITGRATFNVAPVKVAQYFNKIECFCFSEQTLQPGERVDMPVTFFVDPALAQDDNAQEVNTITLAYTFFRAEPDQAAAQDAGRNDPRKRGRQGPS